ncbi:S41 family peptidase [Marinilabilia sp.]|uniref:S41 family peptidase n=1 Tax=Marinilabilia sp. TaxID=2021252 RepID=UPI0025C24CCD|nr:S41 family peptidase [Marinilabilia sp.]
MKHNISLLFLVLTLVSCEKIFFEADRATNDPFINFEYLWTEVDEKYSYHEYKGVDWDAIGEKYKSMLYPTMSEDSLFAVLATMLKELRDDHVNLVSPFNISSYEVFLTGPDNYNARTIRDNYIKDFRVTGAFNHAFIKNEKIGYIKYDSFSEDVDKESLNYILSFYKDTEGLIIDLRTNGGGNPANIAKILERFSNEKTLVGYNITRNGPGHNDFGPREPFYIGVYDGVRYHKPIMVLIDRSCYSACTFFAFACKSFPSITLVGDTTGGGGGLPNGGQLPNSWTYRFSVSQLIDVDGNNYAEGGVAPDIQVNFDWSDLSRDEILDKAIDTILKD